MIEDKMKIRTKGDLEKTRERGLASLYPGMAKVSVGMATCGLSTGAGKVYEALQKEVEKESSRSLESDRLSVCREPVVVSSNRGRFSIRVTPERSSN
jgi:hypothetical protein